MTEISKTLWEIEPHTQAKHEILRRYLGAWFPILGSRISRIVYIDGFCGPGRYLGGEDGSPIIALNEALKQSLLGNSEVNFLFIDERRDRIQHLEYELSLMDIPRNFHPYLQVNEFETTLTEILDGLNKEGHRLAPTFAFIDPFGFKGAPFSLIKRLLSNQRTEVFINIMIDYINRFVEHPTPSARKHIIDLLGATSSEISQIINSPDRKLAFRQLYQSKLHQFAKFVRYFEMRDYRDRVIYYLFFASNHPLGHVKMKEAFWRVDNQSGFRFSDHTDPSQLVLFEIDPSIELAKVLKDKYYKRTVLSEDVISFVDNETAFISKHAKSSLKHLEKNNEISVEPLKSNGERRRKYSFPDGVVIHF